MNLIAGLLLAGAAFLDAAARPSHFDVSASYEARRGAAGEIAVRFVARDPDVKINEVPAPKLKVEAGPAVLAAPTAAAAPRKEEAGGGPGKYLDLTLPVVFPATLAAGTPPGRHDARATVTYFYCSKREGWCRKGTAAVEFPVVVP